MNAIVSIFSHLNNFLRMLQTPHSASMPQLCRKSSVWEAPFGNASNFHPFSDTDISPPGR